MIALSRGQKRGRVNFALLGAFFARPVLGKLACCTTGRTQVRQSEFGPRKDCGDEPGNTSFEDRPLFVVISNQFGPFSES